MAGTATSVDGVTVAFEDRGSGDPVLVFIHGLAGDRSDWDYQFSHFSGGHRVVAIDLPGNGDSGRDRHIWTMAAFGEDVASVADHLGLEDMILVGHSLGGDVVVEAALRLTGRVRGLVWVSSYRSLGSPKTAEQIEAWLAPFRSDFASATEDLARRSRSLCSMTSVASLSVDVDEAEVNVQYALGHDGCDFACLEHLVHH